MNEYIQHDINHCIQTCETSICNLQTKIKNTNSSDPKDIIHFQKLILLYESTIKHLR